MKDDAQIWQKSINKDVADASVPIVKTGFYARSGKRIFDLTFVAFIAPAVVPIILISAAAIALDGKSPFFAHKRVGENGKLFACWKLRTMVANADEELEVLCASSESLAQEWHQNQKLENDPRITKVGKFLRRSRIDELPQFWNVWKGDMSVVGPRPVTSPEIIRFGTLANARLAQKPGVTGSWQVSRSPNFNFDDRIALDLKYLNNMTFWLDLKIIGMTVLTVFRMNGH